jgi:hypothetical protein
MALIAKHTKTVTIPDPTQTDLDAQIALGNYPKGTTLANIALASDHNENIPVTGTLDLTTQVTGDLPFSNIAQIAATTFAGNSAGSTADIAEITMTTAKLMLGYEFGVASAENTISQSVAGGATFTQNIALDASNWTNGCIIVKDTTSGTWNTGALIHFGTATTESSGVGGSVTYISTGVYIGAFESRLNVGDGFVTGNAFLGAAAGVTGSFRINSVRINGANLEIIWRNVVGVTQTITARMRYYLWRGDKDTTP